MTGRPGLVARMAGLVRGAFASWLRAREEGNPKAVYENAIAERVSQYRELKEAVAGILYLRNKLEGEIAATHDELARAGEDVRRALARADEELALGIVARRQALAEDLAHAEGELAALRDEAEEAKANLVRFRDEIHALEREKGRTLASLANARARRRIQETLSGLSVDADVRALEAVRAHVARLGSEGALDRELGTSGLEGRLRSIREESRREAARHELAELKREIANRQLATGPRREAAFATAG